MATLILLVPVVASQPNLNPAYESSEATSVEETVAGKFGGQPFSLAYSSEGPRFTRVEVCSGASTNEQGDPGLTTGILLYGYGKGDVTVGVPTSVMAKRAEIAVFDGQDKGEKPYQIKLASYKSGENWIYSFDIPEKDSYYLELRARQSEICGDVKSADSLMRSLIGVTAHGAISAFIYLVSWIGKSWKKWRTLITRR